MTSTTSTSLRSARTHNLGMAADATLMALLEPLLLPPDPVVDSNVRS
ncbi:MAG: hypothetical protein M1296_00160 [Chloroflexi bacterium]|nr:hypothetical protein [Chloroflexota bacterium]